MTPEFHSETFYQGYSEVTKIIFHSPTRRMIWSVSDLYSLPRSALSRLAGESWIDKGKPSGGQEKGLTDIRQGRNELQWNIRRAWGKCGVKPQSATPLFFLLLPLLRVCVDTITCSSKLYPHFHHCPSFGLPLMPRSVYAESIVYPKEGGTWWRNLAKDFKH